MPSFVRSGAAIGVNSQTSSSQNRSSITALGDGGFVVVWQTANTTQDGSGSAIKLQRYDAQGIAVGSEALVNNVAAGDQSWPRVTSLASGGFAVTWETGDPTQDGNGTAIKARLFDAAGIASGGEFLINSQAFANQQQPTIAGLADGGFVVAWQTTDSAQDGSGWAVKAQRFSAAGAPVGTEFRVNTAAFGSQNNIDIASLSNGGFIVTWQTGNDMNSEIYAQAYGADGAKAGTEILVSTDMGSQTGGRVVGLANGGFVVTWITSDAEGLGIRAQIFDAARNKVGADFAVNTATAFSQFDPDIAVLGDGTFMITWQTQAGGIKGQSFGAAGQRLGGEVTIVNDADAEESGAAVAALAGGNFVVGWTHNVSGSASGEDIKLQMLRPNTAPELGAATRAISVGENNQNFTTITATDADGPSSLSYSIVGGTDAARFNINSVTGALRFLSSPNFEAPADSNGDNVYQLIVRASDGDLTDLQTITVTVTNVNEGVTITSNGGGSSAAIVVIENETLATTVTAVDVEGGPITYSIHGGADSGLFAIDASTGALTFLTAPDFEQPGDMGGDNVYQVTVRASDGQNADTQVLAITVDNYHEAPVIVSNGGDLHATVSLEEGTATVTTVVATDEDGGPNPISYSIAGGADADLFTIDAVTGVLSFIEAPDHETPLDWAGDNSYSVRVAASDGVQSDEQDIQVQVIDVDEGVTFAEPARAFQLDENMTEVGALSAISEAGDPLAYAIEGGADAALFAIDAETGVLRFLAGPDFEQAGDSDGDNVYDVIVSASDGSNNASQSVAVTVGDIDEAVEIFSYGGGDVALTLAENGSTVGRVEAHDEEGETIDFVIVSGADSALFIVDAMTGVLSFIAQPDFEAPADGGGDNVYDVVVAAYTYASTDTQAFSISVVNANEGIFITSDGGGTSAAFSLEEGERDVTGVQASDPDGTSPVYSIVGGADALRFTIDAVTGALSFLSGPDFEAPADSDGDNAYEVVVAASDGEATDTQSMSVTVTDRNEPIEIFSYGGAATVALTMAENGRMVGDVEASDPEFEAIVFAITGGADAALFAIDADSGALTFIGRPDFEAPGDAGGDNVYEIVVTAGTPTSGSTQAFAVTIVNENEGIFITSNGGGTSAALSTLEGERHVTTVVAHDPDGTIPVYSIIGGPDASLFAIDPQTGVLTFIVAPDHEAPADAGAANFYTVDVAASDGEFTTWQKVQISVGNVDEPVTVTSHAGAEHVAISVSENSLAVTQVAAADADGGPVSYAISGGADAALFTIDEESGALSFVAGADFEAPADGDGDNVYELVVSATDGAFTDSQSFAVTVTAVDEAVAISSDGGGASAAVTRSENGLAVTTVTATDPDGGPVTYAIAGGADAARFKIDASTGALAFISAPDFESPADAGANNVYDVIVSASDGGSSDSQAIAVTIGNVNEPVAIVSNGGGASAAVSICENASAVTVVAATDFDGGAVAYSITGGADAARFTIDAGTGALDFVASPDFEAPADAGADNVYDVIVSASDGTFADSQAIAVTIGNVNEPVAITSNGGGAGAAIAMAENASAVTLVAATDADGGAVTYAIAGGADAARFTIDAATGALAFVSAPNFEAPADVGANNVYDVIVSASDGALTDSQTLAVTVGNVNEPVAITSNGGGASTAVAVAENGSAVTIVAATDPDGAAVTYAIAGGADAARFTINAATGALAFAASPNFEAPADAGSNNVYDVVVSASDGTFSDQQALAVTVTNVLEGNVITGTGSADTIATTKTVAGQPFATQFEDTISGLGGADTLMGGGGADIIDGGAGNDLIYGDAGADRLTGGIGADRFTLKSTDDSQIGAPDLITDFNRSQADRIGLADIDARTNAGGNQSFAFIGTAAFSGVSGQLRYEQVGGNTFVTGDVNGDRVADFQIQLQGLIALTSADFIL